MSAISEIGGYLELERFEGQPYHKNAIALNCGRGCLSYLIELRQIERIWVPDYMCGSVPKLFRREGVEVLFYPVGMDMRPEYHVFSIAAKDWIYLADYFGQLKEEDVREAILASDGRLIVDETQGFFRSPWRGADTLYTCRKWFGVSDGGYLVTADGAALERTLPLDESHNRMGFLLGRFERPASDYYAEASRNNDCFDSEPAKIMSPITQNILRAVDYDAVKLRRDANWDVLDSAFSSINEFDLIKPEGAFMYPLLIKGAQRIRAKLIEQRIYIPCLWPDVAEIASNETAALRLARNVLPLPLDQRYGVDEMDLIVSMIEKMLR